LLYIVFTAIFKALNKEYGKLVRVETGDNVKNKNEATAI